MQRQYWGALGKIATAKVAVSSALLADGRTWPLAFDLYLPTSWTDDTDRRAAAGLPDAVVFREKWKIALAQVRTIVRAGFTITSVVVDADYGRSADFCEGLERLGLPYWTRRSESRPSEGGCSFYEVLTGQARPSAPLRVRKR